MYSRILVAVDESPHAEHALARAASLAKGPSAALRIIHVVDMGWLPLGPELAIDIDVIVRARRAAGEKILTAARDAARAAGVEAETRLLETATPTQRIAAAIADEAASWPADVVVLGTHGRRGVERLLLGSVAEGVARLSTVPVLLIPRQETGR
ncbi:MAG TPA: universal stress protein, partial [Candidatus Methylomirabilis sp.]|nr:universal stress protein [Candidatus Methylomirabilis sp.]